MKPFNFTSGRLTATIVLALLAGTGLSACGGRHSGNSGDVGGGDIPPPPAPVRDAFFTAVSTVISASSESTEPNAIDAVASTTPENGEPESLG